MDCPDPDEEFEMMYEDEMEYMNELEMEGGFCTSVGPISKSRRSLDFSSPPQKVPISSAAGKSQQNGHATVSTSPTVEQPLLGTRIAQSASPLHSGATGDGEQSRPKSMENGHTTMQSMSTTVEEPFLERLETSTFHSTTRTNDGVETAKRKIDELFGDIDDLDFEEDNLNSPSKKNKVVSDEDLIQRILGGRKEKETQLKASRMLRMTQQPCGPVGSDKTFVSARIPKWPFLPVTNGDGERLYVRIRSEQFMVDDYLSIASKGKTMGLLSVPYEMVMQEAESLIQKKMEREDNERIEATAAAANQEPVIREKDNTELWVEKYKPHSYIQLLSDEATNRTLFHWLKLWDKVVFNVEKRIKHKQKHSDKEDKRFKKKFGQELTDDLDEHGCPKFKLALLCGPPGLGKTTLAHMIGQLAGYNVVEVNASDERSPEAFRLALQAATQMRAVIGEKRPNCLILDEIDGAPAASIEVLVKFATGKDVGKGRGKKKGAGGILKRPIICICNDVYVPALRSLRQLSFVVHFPPTSYTRLAQRLLEIARKQHIRTDMTTLLALAQKSQNDIRSCVSLLHFFKAKGKGNAEVRMRDVQRSSVGQKDVQKGLFTVWHEIFQIQRSKVKAVEKEKLEPMPDLNAPNVMFGDTSLTGRMQKVLRTVQSCGDYEKLTTGVFENYLHMNFKDSNMTGIVDSLDWFCNTDIMNHVIYGEQNYVLMPYLPQAFVVWHFNFASYASPKINYPYVGYENSVKETRNKQLLKDLLRGMLPRVRAFTSGLRLILDTLPILLDILVPNLRPVSTQLYSTREKAELYQVISIMIDYNLTYIQERTQEGSYVFNLDPNVEELCLLPGMKPVRSLSYANKQMLAREVDLEKMRRADTRINGKNPQGVDVQKEPTVAPGKPTVAPEKPKPRAEEVPRHLQTLKPKPVAKRLQDPGLTKDFFGRFVPCENISENRTQTDEIVKSDIWFHFKEGFSNAVRRSVRIQDLV